MDIQELNAEELNTLYNLLCGMEVSIDKVLETRTDLSIYVANELKAAQEELRVDQYKIQNQLAILQ